ncbi:MAG TPA: ABC transporter permease [Candidatus Acidoferrales bacterium]|nr:ABC transporter permease [Candidatus Acidoferrales bacterium]
MKLLGGLIRRLRMLFRRKQFDRDMDEEMRAHIEMRERELRESGAPTEQAYTDARKHFGNALALREASHESWGWSWLEHLTQDLRFAFRMLRKSPGFTAVAILTLALGIGANTAIFSIINAIFLRPLPYPKASQIYLVARTGNAFGGESISPAIFSAWRQRQEKIFAHLTLVQGLGESTTLMVSGEAENVLSMTISTDFLAMVGIHPILGRDFVTEEGRVGGPNVVMLSDSLWRERFGADPHIVGRNLTLNSRSYTVVGVLPPGFTDPTFSPTRAQLWFPAQVPATSSDPSNGGRLCFGALKPGVSVAEAEAALTPALSDLRREFPKMFRPNERAHLIPLREMLNQWAGTTMLLIFGAVGLVLLIACVNVANLTLARSATRQREIAVRTVIGASRGRIVRQLLTESILLAVLGGVLGIAACYASFQFVVTLVPANLPHVGAFGIDARVLLFAFALSIATGIAFGLVPALGASRVDLSGSLKESGAQAGARAIGGLRRFLAASEIAISLVLLIGAALALESLARLTMVKPGFDTQNVLTFAVSLPSQKYDTAAKRTAFFDQAISRVSAIPGVEQAAIIDTLPLREGSDILFSIEGGTAVAPAGQPLDAEIRIVSPDYFRALRIPLISGREFTAADNASGAPVVVINQTMARMFWPGKDPIGQQIWIGKPMGPAQSEPAPRRVIGIVGDVRESTLEDMPGQGMFIPYTQTKWNDSASFLLRTRAAAALSLPEIRSALHDVDPGEPLTQVESMEQVVSGSLNDWRFHAILLGIFGALAVVIAAVGVYGVISYSVAQRTHEIGIRLALGAQRRDVLRLVLSQGASLALAGIVVGMLAAIGLTRLMASLLYGVAPTDPVTFIAVAILLLIVALIACYLPARRAMRVDPMVALRYE